MPGNPHTTRCQIPGCARSAMPGRIRSRRNRHDELGLRRAAPPVRLVRKLRLVSTPPGGHGIHAPGGGYSLRSRLGGCGAG